MLTVDISIGDLSIKLLNIYAPNKDSPEFFIKIRDILESSNQTYTLLCEDLNLVIDPLQDCDQYKHVNNPKSRQHLIETMNIFNLYDTFRLFNPSLKRYTWRRKNPVRQARLDYFLVSHTMHDLITSCAINPSYRSDHSSVQIKIMLSKFEHGKGLWKFNCSLLKDEKYLKLINSVIQDEKHKYALPIYNLANLDKIEDNDIQFTITDGHFLEMLLLRIRGETIKFASYRKKQDKKLEEGLKYEINILENSQNPDISDILEQKKKELENLRQKIAVGSAVRARTQWLSEGEKPSKFFCSLEKYNYTEKTIKRIKLDNAHQIINQKEILQAIQNFYSTLFSEQTNHFPNENLDTLLEGTSIRKLTTRESNTLDGELEMEELGQTLKQMKNGKCPGVDGFPAVFQTFLGKAEVFYLTRS